MKKNDKLDEYISLVTLDFLRYTDYVVDLVFVETERIRKIRMGIILLIKLYRNILLTDSELNLLERYPLYFDINSELTRCISHMVYRISMDSFDEVNNLMLNEYYFVEGNDSYDTELLESFEKYLYYLDRYISSFNSFVTYNNEIQLIEPNYNVIVHPVIDFDDPRLVKRLSRKKSLIEVLFEKVKG